ncbi:hypothetical protein PMIN07_007646 [Paraphaeosphaeria minitans]
MIRSNGDFAGGISSIPLDELPTYIPPGSCTSSETPTGNGHKTSGSGPYPAATAADSSLPGHTIFAPKTPPAGNLSMPLIAWGNDACTLNVGQYQNFLVEIPNHGYVVAADGTPSGSGGTSS